MSIIEQKPLSDEVISYVFEHLKYLDNRESA